MYSSADNMHTLADSKYTVADILSSMANGNDGEVVTPTTAFISGITSGTTPTLTPSTLQSIEQSFINMESNQMNGNDRHMQSGFVPPVVSIASNHRDNSDPDWAPTSAKRQKNIFCKSWSHERRRYLYTWIFVY